MNATDRSSLPQREVRSWHHFHVPANPYLAAPAPCHSPSCEDAGLLTTLGLRRELCNCPTGSTSR